ncbi:hypothetical protein QYF36_006514 [Acer negundo]|nr:hypothetical protein QYF36_006514 [Acer negundo]
MASAYPGGRELPSMGFINVASTWCAAEDSAILSLLNRCILGHVIISTVPIGSLALIPPTSLYFPKPSLAFTATMSNNSNAEKSYKYAGLESSLKDLGLSTRKRKRASKSATWEWDTTRPHRLGRNVSVGAGFSNSPYSLVTVSNGENEADQDEISC